MSIDPQTLWNNVPETIWNNLTASMQMTLAYFAEEQPIDYHHRSSIHALCKRDLMVKKGQSFSLTDLGREVYKAGRPSIGQFNRNLYELVEARDRLERIIQIASNAQRRDIPREAHSILSLIENIARGLM